MNDQTPSGNRWEPTGPEGRAPTESEPTAPRATPAPTASVQAAEDPAYDGPPPGRGSRLRTLLVRPGRAAWLAGLAAALVVLAGASGFLVGRATVDSHDSPAEIGRDWQHPGAPFDDDRDGDATDPDGDHGFPPPQDGSDGGSHSGDSQNSSTTTGDVTGNAA